MTTEIPVSGGLVALVDDADAERVAAYTWYRKQGARTTYVLTNIGPRVPHTTLMMHRLIMDAPKGLEVDHINGDGLDNRRDNLRLCTHQENLRNAGCHKSYAGRPVTSQFKGVYRRPDMKDWIASATVNGRTCRIGHFPTEGEAALAYNAFVSPLHGKFAKLNTVPVGTI